MTEPSGGPGATNETLALVAPGRPILDYLPVGLFGSAMGVTGLSVAWHLAHRLLGTPEVIALGVAGLGMLAFTLMLAGYTIKLTTAFDTVRQEFQHPIAGSLFGTVLISLLQLPLVVAPFALGLARIMWVLGAAGMILFALMMVSRWMTYRQEVAHATPAWIVPVVGILNVPLALPVLGLPVGHGLMVFALAIGLFFAVPLFTLIFARLLFEPPLPVALRSSLLILVAPFAVGYSTYTVTTGQTDLFAEALYMLTLFILAVLLGRLRDLPFSCPFRISWWAVSFPLAACSVAGLRFATARPGAITEGIAIALLALASLVIAGLLAFTVTDITKGGLRRLSA